MAYVFERFPSFTQTFCAREVLEMERQGMRVMLFSIRDTRDEEGGQFPEELVGRVHFLPPEKELVEVVKGLKAEGRLPQAAVLTLRNWGDRDDKMRVYEAIYIGLRMEEAGVRHAHSHFAGVGARTCWWLRRFFDFTFSFTGHANDLFCKTEFTLTLDHLMRDAAVVVTVSDFTAGDLRRRFPGAAGKVRRVYNGLDLEPFEKAAAAAETGGRAGLGGIASVGRLIEKKGFDDLVAACGMLRDRGVEFRCQIVGDGPLEGALRAQISELGLAGKVLLVGALGQGDIVRILAEETQVFCLPCVVEADGGMDNLPTVIMEAMAASLPCVSTRLAGVPEMVIDGETGLVAEPRKPGEIADGLEALLGDAERCRAMGRAGALRARALFAKEVTAGGLRRVLVSRGLVGSMRCWRRGGFGGAI